MSGRISFRLRWFDALFETPNDAKHGRIDAMTRAVAAALFKRMKPDGTARPGTRLLAREAGMSHPIVEERVERLEAAGWLEVERRNGATNHYQATIPTAQGTLRGEPRPEPVPTAQSQRQTAQSQRQTAQSRAKSAQRTFTRTREPGNRVNHRVGASGGPEAAPAPTEGQGRVDHSEAPQAPSPSKPAEPPKPKVLPTLEAFQPFTVRELVLHSTHGSGRITKVVPNGKAIVARFDGHGEVCIQLADVDVVTPGYTPPPNQTGAS